MPADPSHILFPSDAPKATPEWFARQQDAAASSMFPSERSREPAPTVAGQSAPRTADEADDAAATLFKSEISPIDEGGALEAVELLDTLAETVRMSGDVERADALADATDVLMMEAASHGMPSADLREIVQAVHGAAATVAPLTPEQLADGQAKALAELSDVPAGDLNLARGLIRQMERKMPGLSHQLEISGLGNDVKFIKAVVREATRRAGRR